MNNITNQSLRKKIETAPSSPKTTQTVSLKTEQAAKRSLNNASTSAPKRKMTARMVVPMSENDPTWHLENGTLETFKTALIALNKPTQKKKMRNAVEWLAKAPADQRKIFEAFLVKSILIRDKFDFLKEDCHFLAQIPPHEDECLELKVIHGLTSFTKEEATKYEEVKGTHITLMHIAAASRQFQCFHHLLKMGFSPFSYMTIAPPYLYFTYAISSIQGTLGQYDEIFETLFQIKPWPAPIAKQSLLTALRYGIHFDNLELISFIQRRAEDDWHEISNRVHFPQDFYPLSEIAITYPAINSLPDNHLLMRDDRKRSLLHWAVALKNQNLLDLLKLTSLAGAEDAHGQLPIQLALEQAQYRILFQLGKMGIPEKQLRTDPWLHALFSESLVWDKYNFNPERTHSKANILHFAAACNHLPLVNACLKTKENWFQKDINGNTPLTLAIRQSSEEISKAIIQAMYEQETLWNQEQNILHYCFELKSFSILKYLLNLSPPKEVLDKVNENGDGLLHLTTKQSGFSDFTAQLLELGANPNIQALNRLTPLHHAHMMQIDLLIEHGAEINHSKNQEFLSPLHIAMYHMNLKRALLLIQNGASMISENIDGLTPFHYCLQKQPNKTNVTLFFIELLKKIYPQKEQKSLLLLLLLKDQHKITELALKNDPDSFRAQFMETAGLIPSFDTASWKDYYYELNHDHFLVSMDTLNEAPPGTLADWHPYLENAPIEVEKQKRLMNWIGFIEEKKNGEGIPSDPELKSDFYNRLNRKLLEILSELKRAEPEIQKTQLNALFDTSRRCGGAWLFDTTEVASTLNPALTGIKERIYQLAHDLQLHLIKQFSRGNVHEFFSYLTPLHDLLPHLSHDRPDLDPISTPKDKTHAERQFLHSYRPTLLIESLLSLLTDTNANLWVSWLLSFVSQEERENYIEQCYDFETYQWKREGAIELLVRAGILKPAFHSNQSLQT